MAEPLVEVAGFCKQYGQFSAVDNLTFRVEAGQIVALLGHNGAGKTTTLRTLAGILRPTAGQLRIAGHDVVSASLPAKRSLGYIPDDPRLFDSLTVWEHLTFTASAYDLKDYRSAALTLLREFAMEDKRDTVARALSRGMRQKVAIMCACLPEPEVLLFDEPLTGLDPNGIRAIQQSIRDRAARGKAIIISSHLLNLVEELCSHVLVLHSGQLRWFGETVALLSAASSNGGQSSLEDAFFGLTDHEPNGNWPIK